MIDLHMHTTYSDGTDNLTELLKKASLKKLEVISITDHNRCKAYEEMDNSDVLRYYDGKVIVGCEFTCPFESRLIEVLGYGFDYKVVGDYLNEFYNFSTMNKNTNILYNRLIDKLRELGFRTSFSNVVDKEFKNEFFEMEIYMDLLKYPENFNIIDENIFDTFSDFYRRGLTNPKSKLFINHIEFKLSLKDVVDLVHDNGGKVFFAHPYQYKYNDTLDFIERMYDQYDLDGIECFYTTFNEKQTNNLLEFAKRRNLLVSGGSDYHGLNKNGYELGTGFGNLCINKSILDNWDINFKN